MAMNKKILEMAKLKQQTLADQTKKDSLIQRPEMIPAELIDPNPENSYFTRYDNDQELEGLANNIRFAGLIHRIVVSKKDNGRYLIISGHRRFKAVTEYLHWDMIPCEVYEGLPEEIETIFLYTANTQQRSLGQLPKFNTAMRFMDILKQYGEISSAENGDSDFDRSYREFLQNELDLSERTAREYFKINTTLSKSELEKVFSGEISLREAGKLAAAKSKGVKMVEVSGKSGKGKKKEEIPGTKGKVFTEYQIEAINRNRLTYIQTLKNGKFKVNCELSKGPIAEKLYAYEELGYTPDELKKILAKYRETKNVNG